MERTPNFLSGGFTSFSFDPLDIPNEADEVEILDDHLNAVREQPFMFDMIQQSFLKEINPQTDSDFKVAEVGLTEIGRTAGYEAVAQFPYEADPEFFPVTRTDLERLKIQRQININSDDRLFREDDIQLQKAQDDREQVLKSVSKETINQLNPILSSHDISQVNQLDTLTLDEAKINSFKNNIFNKQINTKDLFQAYEGNRLNLKEFQELSKLADKVNENPNKVNDINQLLSLSGIDESEPLIHTLRNNLLEADNPIQSLSTNLNIIKEARKEQTRAAYKTSRFIKVPLNKVTVKDIDDGKNQIKSSFTSRNIDYKTALLELQKLSGLI